MNVKDILRIASLGAVLLASSCAAPMNSPTGLVQDPRVNHPILVDPDYRAIRLPFQVADAGLLPDDNARFTDFIRDYLDHGSGSIAIAVASNASGDAAIRYFGERVADMGVPRDRIMVSRRQDNVDQRVELNFISYRAHVAKCGDWSVNVADTSSNLVQPNFGCANQQNIAAMVADPRDLISPRDDEDRSNVRRADVFDKYGKGQSTSAQKSDDQSATLSTVGK